MLWQDVFYDVFRAFGITFFVYASYRVAFELSKSSKRKGWEKYSAALLSVLVLSFLMMSIYGTHVEDADPLYGGGDTVVDFEPTSEERWAHGSKLFLMAVIPALYGVYQSQRKGKSQMP
jgi:hypothetical protein